MTAVFDSNSNFARFAEVFVGFNWISFYDLGLVVITVFFIRVSISLFWVVRFSSQIGVSHCHDKVALIWT